MKNILSNVHQIALIPSCGDVLTLMNSFQRILRITKGGMVTTYISTKIPNESYCCVGNAGKQVYACVVHVVEKKQLLDNKTISTRSIWSNFDVFYLTRHLEVYKKANFRF